MKEKKIQTKIQFDLSLCKRFPHIFSVLPLYIQMNHIFFFVRYIGAQCHITHFSFRNYYYGRCSMEPRRKRRRNIYFVRYSIFSFFPFLFARFFFFVPGLYCTQYFRGIRPIFRCRSIVPSVHSVNSESARQSEIGDGPPIIVCIYSLTELRGYFFNQKFKVENEITIYRRIATPSAQKTKANNKNRLALPITSSLSFEFKHHHQPQPPHNRTCPPPPSHSHTHIPPARNVW